MSLLGMRVKPNQNPVTSITILAQSDNMEELSSMASRQEAIKFAKANGLPAASGLGGMPIVYPVDENDEFSDEIMTGKKPFKCFQGEYVINASLR